jgi:RNA polymerase sigma factor (sigma-70 family)
VNPDRRKDIEQFFLTHRRAVGGYVCARVGDVNVAESIAGSIFLTVVRCWDQCHSSRTAWLWAIVRNEVARHFRDHRKLAGLDEVSDEAASPAEEAELAESRQRIRQALEQLNDEQREIVYLKFFEQMRNRDIAEATGRSAENIGVIVHRALRRLRSLMESTKSSVSR